MNLLDVTTKLLEKDEILKLMYIDMLQPGAKQVGAALDTILSLGNTVLLPIRYLNGMAQINFKKSMEDYQCKMSNVELDNINYIPTEIGVDILDRLKIVQNEKIRELYVNILAAASNKDTYPIVHPKIIKTVELLTPDEAIIIEQLATSEMYIIKTLHKEILEPARETKTIGLQIPEKTKTHELNYSFSNFDDLLCFSQNGSVYIENLIEWGIIKLRLTEAVVEHDVIRDSNQDKIEKIHNEYVVKDSEKLELVPYIVDVTEFGKKFLEVCVNE